MKKHIALANQYIDDVLSGKQLSCEFVRQACRRQREDLASEDFEFTFDEDRASHVCKFIELLPHIEGEWARKGLKITLEPWQCFLLTTVFGWIDANGLRRYRSVYIEVPRKNAKSTITSGVGLYLLAADGEQGAQVYSAATTRDQAAIVWKVAKRMAAKSAGMQARFGVGTSAHAVFVEHTASTFKPLSRDQGGNHDGYNVHGGLIDELHAHKTREIFDVIETGTGAREQPLLWSITTAGSNRTGICYEQRDYVRRILGGAHVDDSYFGIIYTLDTEDDWTDPAVWEKANPNWGVSVKPDDIERKARKAMELPSAQNNFLTKHLNVWVNAATSWLDMRRWDECSKPLKLEDFASQPCWVGLDLAERSDIAALSILFKRDNTFYHFGRYYLNEHQVETSGNSQYSGWMRSGHLTVNDGDVTDFDVIAVDLRELCQDFDVQEIAFDPAFSSYFATKLVQEGLPMVEIKQAGRFFTQPFLELEGLVYGKKFEFDGNPVMTWMVSNTMTKTSQFNGLVHPVKERPENKIDGVISLLMALGRAMTMEESATSVYDTENRGILSF
jgi:phage terminase large subunit-like protein